MEPRAYPAAAVERAMKAQEVILRAMDGRLKWDQAAEILGISDRQMRRWKQRYEQGGYDGLFDRRRQQSSPKRVPLEVVRQVLTLYWERYFDYNVLHCHEKLQTVHGITLSYTWVKTALQTAGLVARETRRGTHRKARPAGRCQGCCCLPMRTRTRGSQGWRDGRIRSPGSMMPPARSTTPGSQESTTTMLAALKAVIEWQGLFCALYTDRASTSSRPGPGGVPTGPRPRPTPRRSGGPWGSSGSP